MVAELRAENKSTARIGEYKTAVNRWSKCFCPPESDEQTASSKGAYSSGLAEGWTQRPVLRDITPATLSTYRVWLIGEGVSQSAADKNIASVVAILRRAKNGWIIPRLPKLKAVTKPRVGLLFTFSAEEIDSIYKIADSAAWPRETIDGHTIQPGAFWRLLLVGGWNYGFRLQEWWRIKSKETTGITWGDVHATPIFGVQGRDVENASGWLTWRQTKTGKAMVLPMNETVRRHVEAVRCALPMDPQPSDRLFPFAHSAGTSKGSQSVYPSTGFYSCWWDLVKRAGIEVETDSLNRRKTHCPKHFRKTARTLHQSIIGSAADYVTGHTPKTVGERHYFNAIGDVIRSLNTIEQPSSFGS